jgi:hypoxanthine phosphoribosyltransferase
MTPSLAEALLTAEVLFEREELEDAIAAMAEEIRADYADGRPVYITVMHGGMLFASQLALELGIDLEFDYLHATRYRGATTGSGLAWLHRPATSLEGRRVLIADDILDEGHTLKAIKQWCEDQGASEVRVAVLAVKRHDRCVEGIEADYIAIEVPDRYVFGYGMDYHEQGRNLPALYALR